ncbi:MAG: hypothetical protein PUG00_02910 [Clostridiales bacterium]|nr:hypothetical protein [Clostridiales bacterium]
MRYSFTEKTSHRQQETAYMLYMIIGSYFHKCSCRSKALEENLFLYYKELGESRQIGKERQIISVSEGVLGECLASMAQMNAEVFISKTDEMYVLRFYTGFEDIVVAVDDKGRYEISLVKDEMVA